MLLKYPNANQMAIRSLEHFNRFATKNCLCFRTIYILSVMPKMILDLKAKEKSFRA